MTTPNTTATPAALIPENVPPELRERPQWVAWKFEWSKDKWNKIPYDPRTGKRASTTDLMTWGTIGDVLNAFEECGYDGIGFVFCSADPFVGIDLDHCRNPETGEIEAWAAKIIRSVKDVVHLEASPSGEGVHLITRGKLRAGGKRSQIEMYGQERFFTVTGRVL